MTESSPKSNTVSLRSSLLAGWHIFQAGSIVYALVVNGYLLVRLTLGERWPWVALANNFAPWLALGGLLLGALCLFARRRWLLVPLHVPIILAFGVWYGALFWPSRVANDVQAENSPRLVAATYNILSARSEPTRVVHVIAGLDADIIGLQELGPAHADLIAHDLAAEYPYQALHPQLPVRGVGLLSRYPIINQYVLPYPFGMLHMRATLDVNGLPVTVYVAHPPPPGNALSPLTYDDDRRNREITVLREDYLQAEEGPLLVLGDFNMTDQSDAYRAMDRGLDDAFREVGQGLGLTWPILRDNPPRLLPPLLRIDYIWYDTAFIALDAWVVRDNGGSDHRPVVAELALVAVPQQVREDTSP
ncbi:MAG: hypothetical protein GYB65_03860 [Chloroflexi bacterium]|nr:hypothetical protein [Chloroflexota bacterium]